MLQPSELGVSLAGLSPAEDAPWAGGPRAAMQWAIGCGFRRLQLDAAARDIRARELGRSGRRDLAGFCRRLGVGLCGLDLWIPEAHFADPSRTERATEAAVGAMELAADLSRLLEDPGAAVLALTLPPGWLGIAGLAEAAELRGVRIADYTRAPSEAGGAPRSAAPPGVGIDPAALLMRRLDPASEVATAGALLVQARLSDATDVGRVKPGTGRLDLLEYTGSLAGARYARPLVLDLRGLVDQDDVARDVASRFSPT